MSVLVGLGEKLMRMEIDQQTMGLCQELTTGGSEFSNQKNLEERTPQFGNQKKISESGCKLVRLSGVQRV